MRTVVLTLSMTLLLGICVWLTTKDSIRPEPDRDRVGQDVPAVVLRGGHSARVATPSAPKTVPRDKLAIASRVPSDEPTYPPAIAVRKWLVGQLVDEGLSELDSERIVRATMDKIAKCSEVYGGFPERPAHHTCVLNAVQEAGMSEAFRRLAAEIKAADPGSSRIITFPIDMWAPIL